MRLIDADALIQNHFSDEHRIALSYADKLWMRRIINNETTIDAVPVVRCEDCRHGQRTRYGYMCEYDSDKKCMNGKHYCSYGEKIVE